MNNHPLHIGPQTAASVLLGYTSGDLCGMKTADVNVEGIVRVFATKGNVSAETLRDTEKQDEFADSDSDTGSNTEMDDQGNDGEYDEFEDGGTPEQAHLRFSVDDHIIKKISRAYTCRAVPKPKADGSDEETGKRMKKQPLIYVHHEARSSLFVGVRTVDFRGESSGVCGEEAVLILLH